MRAWDLFLLGTLTLLTALSESDSKRHKERPAQKIPVPPRVIKVYEPFVVVEKPREILATHKQKKHHHKTTKKPRTKESDDNVNIGVEENLEAKKPNKFINEMHPTMKYLRLEGDMFAIAKLLSCPRAKELKCKNSPCGQMTCSDAPYWSQRVCPPVPAPCHDLYCGCANSMGYFQESKSKPKCVRKAECRKKKYKWLKYNETYQIGTESADTDKWFVAGTDNENNNVSLILAEDESGWYPGYYIQAKGNPVIVSEDEKKKIIDRKNIKVLSDPDRVLKWFKFTAGHVMPGAAFKAGLSRNAVPQYIGKIKDGSDYFYGRVQFGELKYVNGQDQVVTKGSFDVLGDINRKSKY